MLFRFANEFDIDGGNKNNFIPERVDYATKMCTWKWQRNNWIHVKSDSLLSSFRKGFEIDGFTMHYREGYQQENLRKNLWRYCFYIWNATHIVDD